MQPNLISNVLELAASGLNRVGIPTASIPFPGTRGAGSLLTLLMGIAACLLGHQGAAQDSSPYRMIKAIEGVGPTGLVEGRDGFLYGTVETAGMKAEGVVFKLSKDGRAWTVLHHFTGMRSGADGSNPQGLVEGSDGALYGTTRFGGVGGGALAEADMPDLGNGTVFRVKKDGSGYNVLHRFTCREGDGALPYAGVIEGRDGALYGTTFEDAAEHGGLFGSGHGTIYKLNKDGSDYRVLRIFGTNATLGHRSWSRLLAGSDGVLYGTTDGGGTNNGGTVFKFNPDGSGYGVLHHFPSDPKDGRWPRAGVIEGRDGVLYGSTIHGGSEDYGTVFRVNRDGSGYVVLHSFTGHGPTGDGAEPMAVLEGADGCLYGSTRHHGSSGAGTVFRMNKNGSRFTLLRSFAVTDPEGAEPGLLIQGRDGALYGVTGQGGENNGGTVFNLSLGTPPSL